LICCNEARVELMKGVHHASSLHAIKFQGYSKHTCMHACVRNICRTFVNYLVTFPRLFPRQAHTALLPSCCCQHHSTATAFVWQSHHHKHWATDQLQLVSRFFIVIHMWEGQCFIAHNRLMHNLAWHTIVSCITWPVQQVPKHSSILLYCFC
jgi:hypothetical protein